VVIVVSNIILRNGLYYELPYKYPIYTILSKFCAIIKSIFYFDNVWLFCGYVWFLFRDRDVVNISKNMIILLPCIGGIWEYFIVLNYVVGRVEFEELLKILSFLWS
jgi:hypothetical protein